MCNAAHTFVVAPLGSLFGPKVCAAAVVASTLDQPSVQRDQTIVSASVPTHVLFTGLVILPIGALNTEP